VKSWLVAQTSALSAVSKRSLADFCRVAKVTFLAHKIAYWKSKTGITSKGKRFN
jgi:hypothetical protein